MQHSLRQRWGNEDIPDNIDGRARAFLTGIGSALSPLRWPVWSARVARAGVITAVFRVREGRCVMEASHSVVTPLEHLWAGAQLHGAAACPARLHRPQVEQVGAHGAAHGGFPQYLQRLSLRHSQMCFSLLNVWSPVSSDEDTQQSQVQQATTNLKVSWSVFYLTSKSFRACLVNIYSSSVLTTSLLLFCNRAAALVFALQVVLSLAWESLVTRYLPSINFLLWEGTRKGCQMSTGLMFAPNIVKLR